MRPSPTKLVLVAFIAVGAITALAMVTSRGGQGDRGDREAKKRQSRTSFAEELSRQPPSPWTIYIGQPKGAPSPIARIRAFEQGSVVTPEPAVIAELERLIVKARMHPNLSPGDLIVKKVRLLLDSREGKLYAGPTKHGFACYTLHVQRRAFSGCEQYLRGGVTFRLDQLQPGGSLYAFGLAADDIKRIELKVNDRTIPTARGANSFLAKLPGGTEPSSIYALIVTTDSGGDQVLPLVPSEGE